MLSENNLQVIGVNPFSTVGDFNQFLLLESEIELCKELSSISKNSILFILNRCSECLEKNKITLHWLLLCIMYFSTIRPKEVLFLAELYSVLSLFNDDFIKLSDNLEYRMIRDYLIKNGSLSYERSFYYSGSNKKINANPYIKNITNIIYDDNIESLFKESLSPNFRKDMKFPIVIENEEKELSFIQCCSYYGSFKCLNFCLINGLLISEEDKIFAIMGGNIQISQK